MKLTNDGKLSEIGETVKDIVCRMNYAGLVNSLKAMGLDNINMAVDALVDLIQEACEEEMTTLTIVEKDKRTMKESAKIRASYWPLLALNRLVDESSYFVVVSGYGGYRVALRRLGDTSLDFFNDRYLPAKQAIADACVSYVARLAYQTFEEEK